MSDALLTPFSLGNVWRTKCQSCHKQYFTLYFLMTLVEIVYNKRGIKNNHKLKLKILIK